ncbi:unnamed protein product [Rodentolepis nana]|uniref:Reverse transcriptase n=1 Tax=Rodentolepis nana TaxID=102285 RepID=A0A0R3TCQ8_RODNA|nr:unnamed protein product [Rodentolepis nana]
MSNHTSPLKFNKHPDKLCNNIKNIMIRCAKKTISRGKSKHYQVFWSKLLEKLKRKWDALSNIADQAGRTEDVQAWRRQSAVQRQAILQAKWTAFANSCQISTSKVMANALLNSWVTSKKTGKDPRKNKYA